MPTLRQLSFYGRKLKRRRCAVAALVGAPQKKGVVVKMGITTPRKPNSAKRKYAKVRMIVAKKLFLRMFQELVNMVYKNMLLFWLKVVVLLMFLV